MRQPVSKVTAAPPEPPPRKKRQVMLVSDAVVALALLLAYVVLTLTGNDGTAILGLLGGYLARAGVQGAADAAGKPLP